MLNYLWGFMILTGIIYAALSGTLPSVTDAALSSAKEAVALGITMVGVMSFWVGLMRIAEEAGIIENAAKRLMPYLRFLFPGIPKGHKAFQYIATNFIANVFGLGWAATPAGLKAMEKRKRRGVKGDVYFFDLKYIFVAAHSGKHHCVPQPVRKRKSGGDRRTWHGGDHSEHRGGSHFLQGDGEKGKLTKESFDHARLFYTFVEKEKRAYACGISAL